MENHGLIVYINDAVSFENKDKMNIDVSKNEIVYKTNKNESETIEETLVAYFYVIDKIKKLGFTLKPMPKEETDYIKNWEIEKFRRNIASGK